MSIPYTLPQFKKAAFNCPFCRAYANQQWCDLHVYYAPESANDTAQRLKLSSCSNCERCAVWHGSTILVPELTLAQPAHIDLPEEIKSDYEEARSILQKSPRGATALLRLALQKLCHTLGESGKDINKDIGRLVSKGLPIEIQQSLDIIRVVGNEQVHPGTLDVRDNPEIATKLFNLINFIVEDRITRPKQIQELYQSLPEDKRLGIEQRDGTTTAKKALPAPGD